MNEAIVLRWSWSRTLWTTHACVFPLEPSRIKWLPLFPKTTLSLDVLQRAARFCSVSLWTLQDLIIANRPSVHSSRAGQDNNTALTSHCQEDSFLDTLGVLWFVRARVYGAAGSTAFCFLEPWNVSAWGLAVCLSFVMMAQMLANSFQNVYVQFYWQRGQNDL